MQRGLAAVLGVVNALAVLAGPSAPAQQQLAPDGWICRVWDVLPSGARIFLDQSVDQGGAGFAISARLQAGTVGSDGMTQSWYWSLQPGETLSRPKALALGVRLKSLDRAGRIIIDHDGGRMTLASVLPVLMRDSRTRGSINIQDEKLLAPLWASSRWKVSVLDRKGAVLGLVDNAFPPRSEVEPRFQALERKLAELVRAPGNQCEEAGPDSTI